MLEALLWGFHNARSGLCFPSYETIAERAGVRPLDRLRGDQGAWRPTGIFHGSIASSASASVGTCSGIGTRWRIIRTSNAYHFHDPKGAGLQGFSSKSEFPSGTSIQEFFSLTSQPPPAPLDPDNPLDAALIRFGKTLHAL